MTSEEATTLAMTSSLVNPAITAMLEATNETTVEEAEFPFCQYDLDAFHTA